eukprot:4080660-Pleurochrysis_carterae.AAC.1
MGGGGRIATTLATAAGRSAAMVALMAPDSAPAVHAAEEAWRELQQRAQAARGAMGAPPPPPPADWATAANVLIDTIALAERAPARAEAHGATGNGGMGQGLPAPRSLRDLPAGSTCKLTSLRSEAGTAARRAADAAVLQPLCALDTLTLESAPPPAASAVDAVARLVAAPGYGNAAWAAVYSNAKFVGHLPSEGLIPASVMSARQGLMAVLRGRVEDVVGEERLPDVADE